MSDLSVSVALDPAHDQSTAEDLRLFPLDGRGQDVLPRVRSYLSTCCKQDVSATKALELLFRGEQPAFIQELREGAGSLRKI